jgi:hypothetical protein
MRKGTSVELEKPTVSFAKRAVHGCVDRYTDQLTCIRFDLSHRFQIRSLRSPGTRRASVLAATDEAPTSSLGFELRSTVLSVEGTRVKRATREIDLGHRDGLLGGESNTRHGGADDHDGANSGELQTGDEECKNANKQHRWVPYFLVILQASSR